MGPTKRTMISNFVIGIVWVIFGLLNSFANLNNHDVLAVVIGIIFLINFIITARLIFKNRNLSNEDKNNWIYRALKLIRMSVFVLFIIEFILESDLIMGLAYVLLGFTYLFESGYCSYIFHKRIGVIK